MVHLGTVELELEQFARKNRYVIHRAPPGPSLEPVCYFVCDENDTLLYPAQQGAHHHGATADEVRHWLRFT